MDWILDRVRETAAWIGPSITGGAAAGAGAAPRRILGRAVVWAEKAPAGTGEPLRVKSWMGILSGAGCPNGEGAGPGDGAGVRPGGGDGGATDGGVGGVPNSTWRFMGTCWMANIPGTAANSKEITQNCEFGALVQSMATVPCGLAWLRGSTS